jgi:hypothetical protein
MTLIPDLQRDLVDGAARMSARRQRFAVRLRLAAALAGAAVLVGATAVLVGRDGSDRAPSSREPAGPPQNSPSPVAPVPPAEPPRHVRPVPGSLSNTVRFEFAGVRYSVVGFRSRNGAICTRLTNRDNGPGRRLASDSCVGEWLLRRGLDRPARVSGGGGGEHTFVTGFAQAHVAGIALLSPRYLSRVVLSEPWRPEPGQGKPIRFFFVLIDAPPDAPPDFPARARLRLEARLTSGETVVVVP